MHLDKLLNTLIPKELVDKAYLQAADQQERSDVFIRGIQSEALKNVLIHQLELGKHIHRSSPLGPKYGEYVIRLSRHLDQLSDRLSSLTPDAIQQIQKNILSEFNSAFKHEMQKKCEHFATLAHQHLDLIQMTNALQHTIFLAETLDQLKLAQQEIKKLDMKLNELSFSAQRDHRLSSSKSNTFTSTTSVLNEILADSNHISTQADCLTQLNKIALSSFQNKQFQFEYSKNALFHLKLGMLHEEFAQDYTAILNKFGINANLNTSPQGIVIEVDAAINFNLIKMNLLCSQLRNIVLFASDHFFQLACKESNSGHFNKAEHYDKLAIKLNHTEAKTHLAELYLKQKDTSSNNKRLAIDLLMEATQEGDARAKDHLSTILHYAESGNHNVEWLAEDKRNENVSEEVNPASFRRK